MAAFTHQPAASNHGTINENEVAASITQAANHIIISWYLSEIFLVKKITLAHNHVAKPASILKNVPVI